MKTTYIRKSGAIFITLFFLALAFPLSVTPAARSQINEPIVNYNYTVINDHGSGSGHTSCLVQTWSSSSSVSGSTLSVSWTGPQHSTCPVDVGAFYALNLYVRDSAGTVVYNGQEWSASGSQKFTFLDNQVIVYVTVTWNYFT